MDAKKSNKIREIVRLQQILKKWRKIAHASSKTNTTTGTTTTTNNNNNNKGSNKSGSNKGIKFLKKTLSFSDNSSTTTTEYVPKGYLAVCVGTELKRYVIPTEYLSHHAFGILLREAEEEFGFQQEGVLKLPCHVSLFDRILNVVQQNRDADNDNDENNDDNDGDDILLFHRRHPIFDNIMDHLNSSSSASLSLSGCCSPDVSDQILLRPYPHLCR